MTKQASGLFNNIFDSGTGGCLRTCHCGITWFDTYNIHDWDEGELEKYITLEKANPEKYKEKDCAIGTISINDVEIVYECTCDLAFNYELFIKVHARQLAEYLNKTAENFRALSNAVRVDILTARRLKSL